MLNPINDKKLGLFEQQVLEVLKLQPPTAYGREFMLDEKLMAEIVKKTTKTYNEILAQDSLVTEKHLSIVTTLASLVCEKAFLETVVGNLAEELKKKSTPT